MQAISNLIHNLLTFEINRIGKNHLVLTAVIVFVIGILYVIGEVLLGIHPDFASFTLVDFMRQSARPSEDWMVNTWVIAALACVVFRIIVIISSYFRSVEAIGRSEFTRYLLTYFSAFLIAMATGFLLMFLLVGLASLFGYETGNGINVIHYSVALLESSVDRSIPSLLHINSYWLAIGVTIVLSALPGYFIHWLCHRSRFCWYVFHRCHHCPQFLHPLATPPAFAFDFLLVLPKGLAIIALSKLVYTEPLVMEMSLWLTLGYFFEIFNHSIVHYDLAYRNFFIRNLSRLFGDKGVYHLVHHSAKEEDQNINLGGGPLMVWDRIFGTYRKPYREAPEIGLTNTPEIRMNPFMIIYSGILQIWYELRMNPGWQERWNILFGSVYYKPPVTREFLILDR